MSVTPKVQFDDEGLPIPPKKEIDFDDEGLPIPPKVKVPKGAGLDFISKVKDIAIKLVSQGRGGELKPETLRTAGPVEEKIEVDEEVKLDPNDLVGSFKKTMPPLFKAATPTADATYVKPRMEAVFSEQERVKPEIAKNLERQGKLNDLKNAFISDQNLSTAQLMKATGLSASQIQSASREQLGQMVREGNETDRLAAQTIADAKDIRQALSSARNLEEAAILFSAIKDPQVARQIEITSSKLPARNLQEVVSGTKDVMADPRSLFGEATIGRMIYQLATNPIAVKEIDRNPELKRAFREAVPNLINKYPDFGKSYLGNMISQKMEDMGMNNAILNVVTKEETDKVVDALASEGKMTPNEVQFYKDNMREGGIRNFAKSLLSEQLYKTTGLVERALGSAVGAVKATGTGIAEITGARKALVGERAMTARDIGARDIAVNVKPRTTISEITSYGGDFLGQVIPTGLLGKGLVATKAFKNPDTAIKALFGLQAYGNYMPQARAMFPGEEVEQRAYASMLAGLEIATENIFRDRKVVDGLLGKVKPEVASVIRQFTNKQISAAAAQEAVEGTIKKALQSVPDYTKYFGKAVGQNTVEETAVQLGQQLTDGIFTGKKFDDWVNGEELLETARTSALGSAFIGGLAARADALRSKGMTAKMIYDMSEKPDYWINAIREGATVDEDLANEAQDKISNLEYAAKVRQDLEATNLTEKQKIKYLINALEANVKAKNSQAITDPVLKKRAEEEAKAIEQQQNDILNGVDQGEIEGDRSDEVVEAGEVSPEIPAAEKVEQLRAAEQAEYAAMPDPNDEVKRKEIYDKYDKLITPLLEKEKEVAAVAPEVQKFGVGFAPFREKNVFTEEEDIDIRNSPDYKLHQENVQRIAEGLGIKINTKLDTWGGYVDSETGRPVQEVSNIMEIEATPEQARLMAAILGKAAPEMQDSVLLGNYNEQGSGFEHIVKTGSFANAQEAIKLLKDNGLQYFSVDKNSGNVIILDLEATDTPKIVNLVKQLNENGIPAEHEYGKVNAEFIGSGDYDAIIESERSKVGAETGFDIDAFIEEAKGRYAAIKAEGKQVKPEEYAVQVEAAGEVPVQPEAGVGEEVEGRVPPAEPKKAPKEGKVEGEEAEVTPGEMVGIKQAATEKMRTAYSLPEYDRPEGKTMAELEAEADQMIKDGYDVEALIKKLENAIPPSGVENIILAKYLAVLNADFDKTKNKETLAKIERVVNALDIIGTIQSEAFRTRKIMKPKEDTLAQYFMDEKADAGVEELTPEQEATITLEYEEIKAAKEALQKKVEELQEQNAKLLAEGNISELKKKVKKVRKSDADFRQERKNIADSIKDKLKKARSEQKVVVVPYAYELISISPEVAKLVKSYVEQGIVNLADIVDGIHELLKEEIKDITKKDVQDLIAGEYKEKKKTKNQLAAQVRDLKTEAKLLVEYEKLKEGKVPVKEERKIERNRKITELKNQIRESDVTKLAQAKESLNKRIAKLEKQIAEGDFQKEPEKKKIKLDEEGRKLQAKLTKLKKERDVRRLKLQYEKQNKVQRAFNKVLEVFNIPRSLMASTDFSAPLNQAVIATINYPKEAREAAMQMIKAAGSQEAFDNWFYDLKETPRYELMNKLKLGITDPFNPEITAREEAFMSGYAEQIPGLGRLVKGSERAYVQYLNKLRVDLFNKFIDKFEADGKTYENNKKLYEATAKYINNITGRGELGPLKKFAPLFNALFFSPRLMAARMNMLNPYYFATLPAELKKQYGKDMGTALGLLSTMLTLFALYGKTQDDDDEDKITVEADPRSSDFARVKQGDTRWDFSGGFQPYLRVASQLYSGERKKVATGEIMELDGTATGTARTDVVLSFFRNKLAPVPSTIVDFSTGKNAIGEKVELKDEILSNIIPLSFQSIAEGYEKKGPEAIATVGVPAIFGVGVSTYEQKKKQVPEKITFEGRRIELGEAKREEFQTIFEEKNGKNLAKLKNLTDYKNADKILRGQLEQIVETKSLSEARDVIGSKYRREFLQQPRESESREEIRVKRRFGID